MRNNFWFITLCFFFVLTENFGLSIPLRVAIGAYAIIIFIDVIKQTKGLYNGNRET